MLIYPSLLLPSRVLLERKSIENLIQGAWESIYEVYVVVVTATTLLPKLDAQVHNWASRKYPWEAKLLSQASYSGYEGANCHLFCLKHLYSVTAWSYLDWSSNFSKTNLLKTQLLKSLYSLGTFFSTSFVLILLIFSSSLF